VRAALPRMARAAASYARAASSAVSNVPSHRRAPRLGSRISAAQLRSRRQEWARARRLPRTCPTAAGARRGRWRSSPSCSSPQSPRRAGLAAVPPPQLPWPPLARRSTCAGGARACRLPPRRSPASEPARRQRESLTPRRIARPNCRDDWLQRLPTQRPRRASDSPTRRAASLVARWRLRSCDACLQGIVAQVAWRGREHLAQPRRQPRVRLRVHVSLPAGRLRHGRRLAVSRAPGRVSRL